MSETVTLREFADHAERYVKKARAGLVVSIVDGDEPLATLTPPAPLPEADGLQALIAAGRVRWTGERPKLPSTRVPNRGVLASQMVIDDRE